MTQQQPYAPYSPNGHPPVQSPPRPWDPNLAINGDSRSKLNQRFWEEYNRAHDPVLDGAVQSYAIGSFTADLAWPHLKLVVELDSFEYHNNSDAFSRDRRKDVHYLLNGWTVARFSGIDVFDDAHGVMHKLARIANLMITDRSGPRMAEALERVASVLERIEKRLDVPALPSPNP